MAQHDYIIANQSGAAFRSDLNNGLAAIVSQNSGVAQPSTTYAYQWWADTATGLLKIRNAANNAWITIGTLADANLGLLSLAGGTLTGALLVDDSGTAALPAIAFDGDPDSGIFRGGANEFGIATNGVERVEFGTTEVVFNDGGADVDFRVEGDTNPDLFKVDAGLDQVQVANLNGGPLAGFRNRIINGNFDFWQRGTSFSVTTANTYTADRWLVFFDGTGATRTISQQSFTPGQTDVPNEPKYFLRFAQSVAGSGSTLNSLDQRIEDVRTFAGQQVTLSFWAKAAASATMPNVQLIQGFGTGGSPSANVSTTVVSNVALTTSWQRFSYQVNVPSISGKTFGTDNNSSTIAIVLTMPLNATFTVDIAQVQLEPGAVATPFEQRPIGTELALCQRYFSTQLTTARTGSTAAGWVMETPIYFPVSMRAVPTIAGPTGASNVNLSSVAPSANSTTHARFIIVAAGAGDAYSINGTVQMSAEL
jgi:hypothetical protein